MARLPSAFASNCAISFPLPSMRLGDGGPDHITTYGTPSIAPSPGHGSPCRPSACASVMLRIAHAAPVECDSTKKRAELKCNHTNLLSEACERLVDAGKSRATEAKPGESRGAARPIGCLAAGHRQPHDLWPVRLLQLYLSDFLNLFFPPEKPEGPEALLPWWTLGVVLGLLGGIGYLAFG